MFYLNNSYVPNNSTAGNLHQGGQKSHLGGTTLSNLLGTIILFKMDVGRSYFNATYAVSINVEHLEYSPRVGFSVII